MYLSKLPLENITLVRDGKFDAFALCEHETDMKIFAFAEDDTYLIRALRNPAVSCLLCTSNLAERISENIGICVSDFPKRDFFMLHNRLCDTQEYVGKQYSTQIGKDCKISPLAYIAPNNIIIGNNVVIEEFVSIKEDVWIGDNVHIRTGSVIGCDGYEYKANCNELVYIKHIGGVTIENDVDIFSNACICKGLFPWQSTEIGESTKIDNLVHIGHACKIGKRNMIVAGVVFCGSTTTGDDVYIGPNATIAKINIQENSKASLGAVVVSDVAKGTTVSGNFAVEHIKLLKHIASHMR